MTQPQTTTPTATETTTPRLVYLYRSRLHDLRLYCSAPQAHQVEAVARGAIEMAVAPFEAALFFLVRFDNTGWLASPFHYRLTPQRSSDRQPPLLAAPFQIRLINPETRSVVARRAGDLPPTFGQAMKVLINNQRRDNAKQINYYELTDHITRASSGPQLMRSALVRCDILAERQQP